MVVAISTPDSSFRQGEVGMDSGCTSTGAYLAGKMGTTPSNECWWCDSGDRESSYYLFVKCAADQGTVEECRACGWKHPLTQSVGTLPQEESATPAVLTPPRETNVGRVVSLTGLGGGGGPGERKRAAPPARM